MTTLSVDIPTLTSERLILRAPREEDAAPLADFYADAEYSVGFGGPLNRGDSWRWHALSVGHWIFRGYGYFSVDLHDGSHIGMAGLWAPEGWPEPELGWLLYKDFQGHGYAYEAAKTVRDWAYNLRGMGALSSNIVPQNTASIRLAERLGARYERSYDNVFMGHVHVYRHPGPETASDNDGAVEAYS